MVTEKNYQSIIEECDKRSPDLSFDSAVTKPKDAPAEISELSDIHARAVENYRRRIYDAWSVLRATSIIVKADQKRYRYNSNVLESSGDQDPDSITADKLRQILESVNALEPIRNPEESSM